LLLTKHIMITLTHISLVMGLIGSGTIKATLGQWGTITPSKDSSMLIARRQLPLSISLPTISFTLI